MDKQELWTIIELELKKQISEITSNLDTIEHSKAQETKSSAGDKFETGRAMMQIEEDKLLGQLKRKKEDLLKLKVLQSGSTNSDFIREGSLVRCGKQWFLIGLSLGKLKLDDKIVFGISTQAPLALKLLGKELGEELQLNDRTLVIEEMV